MEFFHLLEIFYTHKENIFVTTILEYKCWPADYFATRTLLFEREPLRIAQTLDVQPMNCARQAFQTNCAPPIAPHLTHCEKKCYVGAKLRTVLPYWELSHTHVFNTGQKTQHTVSFRQFVHSHKTSIGWSIFSYFCILNRLFRC